MRTKSTEIYLNSLCVYYTGIIFTVIWLNNFHLLRLRLRLASLNCAQVGGNLIDFPIDYRSKQGGLLSHSF